jgi:F-type H+-transporting ATPase subunit epsilon
MAGGTIQVVVVTPERAVLDEQADFVALPLYDGELGVLPGRAPLIGRLGAGELRVRKGTVTKGYFVDGGFAQVRNDVVTVLTARALPSEEIKPDEAARALEAARAVGKTPEEQDKLAKAQERARAQLRIARKKVGQF